MNKRTYLLGGLAITLAATMPLLVGCGGATATTAPPVLTSRYDFTTFDGPGGAPTTVNGINNDGTVVGFTTQNGVNQNFLRTADGTFTMLDVGDPAMGMANAVNSMDAVVGAANGSAFLLAGGTRRMLAPPGAQSSVALGISDMGLLVGQYAASATSTPGFVYANGRFTTVSPTAKSMVTNVQGINNDGLAIGFYSEDGTTQHGFVYDTSTKRVTLLPDPSTARTRSAGLMLTQFLAINDLGQAAGYYQTNDGSQYGFLFDVATKRYTFLDHPKAAPFMGAQVTQITGIDNDAMITGFFVDAQGMQHGFVASPASM